MEVTMPTEHEFQADPPDIRGMSRREFFLLKDRIAREARAARSAAIGETLVRVMTAGWRCARVLWSAPAILRKRPCRSS
jgi:hypothetical protein